jgi:hypothetical protein
MAVTVSFIFPVDADAVRQRDAICGRNGYQAAILDANNQSILNPETKQQFAKRMTRKWWAEETRAWELQQQAAANASTYTDIGVTDG